MKSTIAFAAAAALIATAGVASAAKPKPIADFAAGNYLFVVTTTAVSPAGLCAAFQQAVGQASYSFVTYVPATKTAGGAVTNLSNAGASLYSIVEATPAGQQLTGWQGPSVAVNSTTFPFGPAVAGTPVGAVTLKYNTTKSVTEVITIPGAGSCTVTGTIKTTVI